MYSVEINENSTYNYDLQVASNASNSYNTLTGDDHVVTVNLTNPFLYNYVLYNTIYINSNGTVGFNTFSNTNNWDPTYVTAATMTSFFLPWCDTNDPFNIYYKEDVNSKLFTLIYNRVIVGSDIPYKVGIKLFLDGSGKAIINFGENINMLNTALLGFSFGSNDNSNFITNYLTGNFNPPFSPLVNIGDNQSFYTNKQIIITTMQLQTPTITNFSIPTKIYGDTPFTITNPTSNSSGSFSYTSSNPSVATILGNTITILSYGNSIITATQSATDNYTSGTITTTFQVNQSTPTNPVIVNNSDELLYFMHTTSTYGNIINDSEINYHLTTPSCKTLTGNNIKITKSNN